MLDHLEIHTGRMADCLGFYRAVLEPLGYQLIVDGDQKGFGHDGRLDFWLVDGKTSAEVHYAFAANDWKSVHAAFDRAHCHGGRQDSAPALAPHIHPDYFAGYARDPDGRLVEFVCQVSGLSVGQG
jgi:catechol 2,3-dioxygenase-like lactoylglutathione lyase family enzyme